MPASACFLVLDKVVLSLLRYALFRVEHVSFVPVQVKIGTFLFQRLKPWKTDGCTNCKLHLLHAVCFNGAAPKQSRRRMYTGLTWSSTNKCFCTYLHLTDWRTQINTSICYNWCTCICPKSFITHPSIIHLYVVLLFFNPVTQRAASIGTTCTRDRDHIISPSCRASRGRAHGATWSFASAFVCRWRPALAGLGSCDSFIHAYTALIEETTLHKLDQIASCQLVCIDRKQQDRSQEICASNSYKLDWMGR